MKGASCRSSCRARGVRVSPGSVLGPHWRRGDLLAPGIEAFFVCGPAVASVPAGIDTRSDYVACGSDVATRLGLSLPFPRQATFSGAGGTQAGTLSFPSEGLVGLFVADFREYCYLSARR